MNDSEINPLRIIPAPDIEDSYEGLLNAVSKFETYELKCFADDILFMLKNRPNYSENQFGYKLEKVHNVIKKELK